MRHIIFVKPDVLIVADDILLDKEASLELRLQPEQEAVRHGNVFLTRDKRATLRLEPLATEMQIIGARGADVAGAGMLAAESFRPTEHGFVLQRGKEYICFDKGLWSAGMQGGKTVHWHMFLWHDRQIRASVTDVQFLMNEMTACRRMAESAS